MSIDRKQSIINAATGSFTMYGYKATTMDQVAKLANVGKGTIYTFFSNKEELFNEIVRGMILEAKAVAEQAIDPGDTFFQNLHRALYGVLDFRKKHQLAIKLSQEVREIGTPAAVEALNQLESAITSFIEREVKKAVQQKELKPCDPKLTAFLMLKIYISLVFDWEKKESPLTKEEIAAHFEFYVMKGIGL
ncbi:TetR/AcrR family transcriptional regulator [Pseudalkalibacillus caeni]|uniref:TetR/AcrR family transcriptional regulator n=1 Tax=Exobacillus caeni TaxID=2574798 RepID=A0A5R9F8Y9_9BACL|nr:TetR/AcrR family transcriptional regulator [Pseudalkalibacillus caeni]TLS38078.1 TetR/AcrR family transcriptional regulator [Pseudalkalibacillus caeni]